MAVRANLLICVALYNGYAKCCQRTVVLEPERYKGEGKELAISRPLLSPINRKGAMFSLNVCVCGNAMEDIEN